MTRDVADLLAVHLLAREAGLVESTADGLRCPLPVVPLFETMDDLQRAPRIVEAFLAHPKTPRSRRRCCRPRPCGGRRHVCIGRVVLT